jgi:hypothetical protein
VEEGKSPLQCEALAEPVCIIGCVAMHCCDFDIFGILIISVSSFIPAFALINLSRTYGI